MEPDYHQTVELPCGGVSVDSGKPVNIDNAAVGDAEKFKSECLAAARNLATTAELETNGKCPEQLEMMIVKDGVPHVREAKDFGEVLSLGCNCKQRSTLKGGIVMMIMLLSNMLNYMDRFTIVGRLKFVTFDVNHSLYTVIDKNGHLEHRQ